MKLSKQDIGVWVDVNDNLPNNSTYYLCMVVPTPMNTNTEAECFFHEETKRWSISPNDRFTAVTHWLKPIKNVYVLTEDQIKIIITYSMSHYANNDSSINSMSDGYFKSITK